MDTKTLKTRIKHKSNTSEYWAEQTFSPLEGELVIYNDDNNKQIKIGDGNTDINSLPFLYENKLEIELDGEASGEAALINAHTLDGRAANEYALKIDTAPDSEKLGGVAASEYALKTDITASGSGDANTLGGIPAESYALKSELENYALKSELDNCALKSELENYALKSELTHIEYIDTTLSASSWTENVQRVDIPTITISSNGEVHLAQTITLEQIESATSAMLHVTSQGEGYIEITAFGDVPEIDIPIIVKVVR